MQQLYLYSYAAIVFIFVCSNCIYIRIQQLYLYSYAARTKPYNFRSGKRSDPDLEEANPQTDISAVPLCCWFGLKSKEEI